MKQGRSPEQGSSLLFYLHKCCVDFFRTLSGRDVWLFRRLSELLVLFADDGYETSKSVLSEKFDELYSHLLTSLEDKKG